MTTNKRSILTEAELTAALNTLPGWSIQNSKLHKQFKFKSFAAALGWMVSVGVEAERMDHHPEWSNTYSRVTVDLTTHDMGGITGWDVDLAKKMEQFSN